MARSLLVVFVVGCNYAPTPATIGDGPASDTPSDSPADTIAPDSPAACPSGFESLSGAPSKYRLASAPLAYSQAVASCAGLGANVHLARVDTQAEVDALYVRANAFVRVVGQRHINNPVSASDDTWHDLDDVTPLPLEPWGVNEPTNGVGELCMTLREEVAGAPPPIVSGADDCTTPRLFVCECE